ncbi:hypothetical protein Bca4012_030057 [Brassica carinata]
MEKQEAELIFIPFPIPGHLLATIELVKLILTHGRRRIHTITILHWGLPIFPPSDNDASLQTLAKTESRIRIVTLPELQNPPPMEFFLKAPEYYILEFVKKMVPSVRDAVSTVLSSSRDGSDTARVAGIVLDMFCVPLMDVGNEFHLPSYIFLTCNAGFLCLVKHVQERHRRVKSGFDRSSGEEENIIPGYVTSVPTKVLPLGLLTSEPYDTWVDMTESGSDSLLQRSFDFGPIGARSGHDVARQATRVIGSVPLFRELDESPRNSDQGDSSSFRDRRLQIPLVYSTDPKDYPSLSEILPDGFLNRVSGLGFVCGWAPQVEILAHKAIGGFLSHCGWNSILESLRFGVPIATWPMFAEQQLNAFTMVKELGLALEMRLDYLLADGEIVKADEIARAVRSLMEGEDVPRRILKEIAGAAKEAVMDGGSSFVAIDRFIDKVVVSAMDCSKSR